MTLFELCYIIFDRMLADESDKSLKDVQQRALLKEDELLAMTNKYRDTEERLAEMGKLCTDLRHEVGCG